MSHDADNRKSVAAEEIGGDSTGATTGVEPGEQPIIPRAADGTPLGNDLAVPDRGSEPGEVDLDSTNRRLRVEDTER